MSKRVVSIHISGQEYRIRSDADEASLQRVAHMVDAAMSQIRARTGMVDTLDVAVLTSLNLGRELLGMREKAREGAGFAEAEAVRMRDLIEMAESALIEGEDGEQTPLLTVPAGVEVDEAEAEILDSLIDDSAVESKVAST